MKILATLLRTQTIDALEWTGKLINGIKEDKWFIMPEVIEQI